MVQLKSFRYFEPEGGDPSGRPNCVASPTLVAPDAAPVLQADSREQQQQQASESDSSSPESSTLVSGGILTSSASSDESLSTRAQQQPLEDDQATLSSTEEYQTAKLDMSDDEQAAVTMRVAKQQPDQQQPASDQTRTPTPTTRIEIGSLKQLPSALNNGAYQVPSAQQLAMPRSSTPDIQRAYLSRQLKRQVSSPVLSSMSPQLQRVYQQHGDQPGAGGNHSPSFMKRQHSYGDNVSQLSFGAARSQLATPNHFEIRWHQLNLLARKSRLPQIISENPIYKTLSSLVIGRAKSLDLDQEIERQHQKSPQPQSAIFLDPLQHKQIPPTISEAHELTEKSGEEDFGAQKLDEDLRTRQVSPSSDPLIQSPSSRSLRSLTPSAGDSEYRSILVNVSGSVFSGQMTAVLGPSGVGKTMLLNTLTGRNTLEGTGRVSLIGSNRKRLTVVTVPQADVLPGKLTTIEDLQFTSRLKNPQRGFDHEKNINRIVKCLQMEKFLYTRIEKLSGGEERRLSIGRELLSSPDILILDEPTSGLDANTCKKIIVALRDIVEHSDYILDRPMSIIVTIHQPQQEVLNLFHRVYVMAVGGRAIYEGPPTMILPTLVEHSSLSRACAVDQLNENPAIVALEVASGEYGPQIIGELAAHHENQFYEETVMGMVGASAFGSQFGTPTPGQRQSPFMTPRSRKLQASPRILMARQRQQQVLAQSPVIGGGDSIGRPTPIPSRRLPQSLRPPEFDRVSNITSVSYASTYDAELPEPVAPRLKVDKRLRRSVVMKSSFYSHTWTLMQRCWLLTTRDMFLMSIRVIGFVLVALGMVQTFSGALDPNEHQCPEFETEVSDVASFMDATKARLSTISSMIRQSNSEHLFLYQLVLSLMMVTSALTGLMFPLQMRMFVREFKNGWYSASSFIMSTTLAELPVDFIGPTISVALTYSLCNQPDSPYHWRELGYIAVIFVASIICKSQAQIVGAVFMDSVENSVFLSCVAVTGPALLSGIAVRVSQMSHLLQLVSFTSFLRYCFESLFLLRYGYGICPCDPQLVHGYPARIASEAIPEQLDNLARGILDLNTPTNETGALTISSLLNDTSLGSFEYSDVNKDDNIFLRYLRLVSGASNLFVPKPSELGICDSYRSLYLMDMDISNDVLPTWVLIMVSMWIISRFLTYFTVRTVIKFRRKT